MRVLARQRGRQFERTSSRTSSVNEDEDECLRLHRAQG